MRARREPGARRVIQALTAPAQPGERLDREAARAGFRAAVQQWPPPASRPRRLRRPLAAAVAAVIVVAGGIAGAYARALPAPVQAAAHSALGPLGVPGRASLGTAVTAASPGPARDYRITLAAGRTRAAAGSAVAFTGRYTAHGRAVAGTRVWLQERLAGPAAWTDVATGVTGPHGRFRLVSPPLAGPAVFRVVAAGGRHSGPVRVTAGAGGG